MEFSNPSHPPRSSPFTFPLRKADQQQLGLTLLWLSLFFVLLPGPHRFNLLVERSRNLGVVHTSCLRDVRGFPWSDDDEGDQPELILSQVRLRVCDVSTIGAEKCVDHTCPFRWGACSVHRTRALQQFPRCVQCSRGCLWRQTSRSCTHALVTVKLS